MSGYIRTVETTSQLLIWDAAESRIVESIIYHRAIENANFNIAVLIQGSLFLAYNYQSYTIFDCVRQPKEMPLSVSIGSSYRYP
jgi:hypothetical protein